MRNQTTMMITGFVATSLLAATALAGPKSDEMNDQQKKHEKTAEPKDTSAHKEAKPAQVGIATDAKFGKHLVDAKGRALYVFSADTAEASACDDACARQWQPLTTSAKPEAAVPALDAAKLGTLTRADGKLQVTFDGKPLYIYVKDEGAMVKGQGIAAFGGDWTLVAPDGSMIGAKTEPKPELKPTEPAKPQADDMQPQG